MVNGELVDDASGLPLCCLSLGGCPSAGCRAPGWLVRHLARLSRLQVREAHPMCCGEHSFQLDKFGAWVVMWHVSPVGAEGRVVVCLFVRDAAKELSTELEWP